MSSFSEFFFAPHLYTKLTTQPESYVHTNLENVFCVSAGIAGGDALCAEDSLSVLQLNYITAVFLFFNF